MRISLRTNTNSTILLIPIILYLSIASICCLCKFCSGSYPASSSSRKSRLGYSTCCFRYPISDSLVQSSNIFGGRYRQCSWIVSTKQVLQETIIQGTSKLPIYNETEYGNNDFCASGARTVPLRLRGIGGKGGLGRCHAAVRGTQGVRRLHGQHLGASSRTLPLALPCDECGITGRTLAGK